MYWLTDRSTPNLQRGNNTKPVQLFTIHAFATEFVTFAVCYRVAVFAIEDSLFAIELVSFAVEFFGFTLELVSLQINLSVARLAVVVKTKKNVAAVAVYILVEVELLQ